MTKIPALALMAGLAMAGAAPAMAQPAPAVAPAAPIDQYAALLTPILAGGETIIGQEIAYPTDGAVNITAALVTIPPGGTTGWHSHEVPLFAYILSGELTVDYGTEGIRIYGEGDGVLEAIDWAHNGTSTGDVPVVILAVYLGTTELTNTVPLD